MKELSGETSGNFKQSLEAMGQLPADYDANELRKAMKVSRSNHHLVIPST